MNVEALKKVHPPLLMRLPLEKRHQLLGELAVLMLASPLHRGYLINDIGAVFLPPINLNFFRVYRIKQRPVGFVTWAFLTDEVEKAYAQGSYNLHPEDWDAGKNAWIIDFIAPFGHASAIVKDLKCNIFPNEVGKAVRIDKKGRVRGILSLHGVNRIASSLTKQTATSPTRH